ncbi:hypothetical protein D9M72_286580 [compost metagenome]
MQLRLHRPARAQRKGLAHFDRCQQTVALAAAAQRWRHGVHRGAVAAGLQHAVHVKAVVGPVGEVAAQVFVPQVIAPGRITRDAAREAVDSHVAFQLAHVQARTPVRIGPQVGAGLEAGEAPFAGGTDRAALPDLAVHSQDAAPGLAPALFGIGATHAARTVVAHALVHAAQHGQIGLAQLLGQGRVQRHFGAVGGHGRHRRHSRRGNRVGCGQTVAQVGAA